MKAKAAESNSTEAPVGNNTAGSQSNTRRQSHTPSFAKVVDGRKQPIRGLWVRNGRFYAQLKIENPITGQKRTRRVPLLDKDNNPVQTVPQAVAELGRLRVKRADNTLPLLRRTPKFSEHAKAYLDFISSGQGTKKASTISKETVILGRWTEHLGHLRIDQIKPAHVNSFIARRLKSGVKPRTVNLDVIGFRCAMKQAVQDGWIQFLPTHGLRPLKTTTLKRPLFTPSDLDTICRAAFETRQNATGENVPVTKNAQQFGDYVRLLAYSGARRNEALALRWSDVDFKQEQLTIGAEGGTKNREARTVDFNEKLKAHLLDMKSRRAPDIDYVFPSPQRGKRNVNARSFQESLKRARAQAKRPDFHFHDCRHHFISMAVMSGIDYMTIAAWVGHKDGGVLIGKVYGHLANEHKKAMAGKLNFGPVVLEKAANQ